MVCRVFRGLSENHKIIEIEQPKSSFITLVLKHKISEIFIVKNLWVNPQTVH